MSALLWAMTAGGANSLTEIAVRSELSLSTTHRLASELTAWGVLERDAEGRYRAGTPVRALGRHDRSCPETASEPNLREYTAPVLEDLFRATGLIARAGYLDGGAVAYIEKGSDDRPVSSFAVAARLPAHATALGKILMAFSPPATVNGIITRGLSPYTRSTITCANHLRRTLRTIRLARIATCEHELEWGWCGVAVPVFGPGGHVLAALELRVQDMAQELPAIRALLAVAAGCLSREFASQHHSPLPLATDTSDWPPSSRCEQITKVDGHPYPHTDRIHVG